MRVRPATNSHRNIMWKYSIGNIPCQKVRVGDMVGNKCYNDRGIRKVISIIRVHGITFCEYTALLEFKFSSWPGEGTEEVYHPGWTVDCEKRRYYNKEEKE